MEQTEDVTVTDVQEESVSSLQCSQKNTEQQGEIRPMTGEEEREGEGKREEDDEDGRQDGENEAEREWQKGTKDASFQSSTVVSLQMQNSLLETRDTFQQYTGEQHSSSRAEPEETVAYPTNSMLTLDSFISAGSPLTVAKAAAMQHLHTLAEESALPYNEDHISTLSEGSTTYMSSASSMYTLLAEKIYWLLRAVYYPHCFVFMYRNICYMPTNSTK